jgi:hypothetical protein
VPSRYQTGSVQVLVEESPSVVPATVAEHTVAAGTDTGSDHSSFVQEGQLEASKTECQSTGVEAGGAQNCSVEGSSGVPIGAEGEVAG